MTEKRDSLCDIGRTNGIECFLSIKFQTNFGEFRKKKNFSSYMWPRLMGFYGSYSNAFFDANILFIVSYIQHFDLGCLFIEIVFMIPSSIRIIKTFFNFFIYYYFVCRIRNLFDFSLKLRPF